MCVCVFYSVTEPHHRHRAGRANILLGYILELNGRRSKTEWHSLVAGVISWNGYYGDSWERVTSSNCRQEPGSVCVWECPPVAHVDVWMRVDFQELKSFRMA